MAKRFFLAFLAAAAILAVGCEKDDDSGETPSDGEVAAADLVGSWAQNGSTVFEFKADGSFTEDRWGESVSGKWSFEKDILTMTPQGGEAYESKVVLTGGKAWLALIYEYEEGDQKGRSFENYTKVGATVKSAELSSGRWDSPYNGYAPSEYNRNADYSLCMIVDGSKMDLYVPMWGLHIQGSFTFSNGKLHIDTDDDHIWKGCHVERTDTFNSIGWSASGPPSDEYEKNWDYSYPTMNPETFQLQSPYVWRTISEIQAMGKNPKEYPDLYKADPYNFDFIIFEFSENERSIAMELCDQDLCVAANGKEAYGGFGPSPWLYKR